MTTMTVCVSKNALMKRINRSLKHDGEVLRTVRSDRWRHEVGNYFIEQLDGRLIVAKHVQLDDLGREIGVLLPTETVQN